MLWGKENEHRAVAAVETATGRLFFHTGDRQKEFTLGRLVYWPDGIDGDTLLEVKCPQVYHGEIRPHYMAQIQGGMHVSDKPCCLFAEWVFGREPNMWFVMRSDLYIRVMREMLEEWWGWIDEDQQPPKLRKRPTMPHVELIIL